MINGATIGKRFLIMIWIGASVLLVTTGWAQESDSTKGVKSWEVRGYLKDLQSLTFSDNFDSLVTGNLIHNRVNVRWNPNRKFTAAAEFRTRLFWGEEVRLTPDFSSSIRDTNEALDLSIVWFETESMVLHTIIDRLWMEYHTDQWDARLGRQRINWGISTIWNPNDIFNTYNFLDFDYEERPGRDAMKLRYHFSGMSNIELSAAASDDINESVAAIKYFTNKWNYDFQFSMGLYQEIFTVGGGWSGSIVNTGFKGELQYFAPHGDSTDQINIALESDYAFQNGWYANLSFLVNSKGINEPIDEWSTANFRLSPQSLMPTKWNAALTLSKEITPLLSTTVTAIYSPGTNLLILLPSMKYNLATNLDFDLFFQSFFAEHGSDFGGIMHRAFLRLKWNF